MSSATPREPLIVLHADPLVLGAVIEDTAGAADVTASLAVEHRDVRLAGIVAADDDDHLDAILLALAPHLAEVVLTDVPGRSGVEPGAAAQVALEHHGFGQDAVFQAADLRGAVRLAVERVGGVGDARWEGTAVLVAGGPAVVDAAALVLADEDRDPE
jgi:hypothetical protein